MYNISTFKTKVTPKLHGTTLAKVADIYGKLHEASGNVFSHVRPYTVIRKYRIYAIYDKLTNYPIDDDCEADAVIDIRPVALRSSKDSLRGSFSKEFDIKKAENTFEIEYINGIKTLRLSKCITPSTVLYEADTLTDGVSVAVGGDISNARLDQLDFVSGQKSVAFDFSGASGVGNIAFTLSSALNLSGLAAQSSILAWFKANVATTLAHIKIRVGSSVSDYYETTVTGGLAQGFTDDVWLNLLQQLELATPVGQPDLVAINFIQFEITATTGTAFTGHIDSVVAALGQAFEVVYYSNRMFTDVTGLTWKEIPTQDTDIIRMEGALSSNAFMYEFMLTLQQEIKGKNMAADYAYFQAQLQGNTRTGMPGLYAAMTSKYPDQAVQRITTYYEFGNQEDLESDDWGPSAPAYMPSASSNGSTPTSEMVTAQASGGNVTIDTAQLSHALRTLIFVVVNGQIVPQGVPGPSDFFPSYTVTDGLITVYNAAVADSNYQLYYTY